MEKTAHNANTSAEKFRQVLLSTFIQRVAQHFAANEDIFPDGITNMDHIHLFCYAYTLFAVHDFYHEKQLSDEDFAYCISEFVELLKENGCPPDELPEILAKMRSLLKTYGDIHTAFIEDHADSDKLIGYAGSILKTIPSAQQNGAFSLEGISFTAELSPIFDYVGKTYTFILEESAKINSANKKEPEAQKDAPENPPKKIKSWLILGALVLAVSLAGNVYLYSENTSNIIAAEKAKKESEFWYKQYDDIFMTTWELREFAEETIEEYYFYNEYAVIVPSGSNQYHRYGCPFLGDSSFSIYNITKANVRGFQPCERCNRVGKEIKQMVKNGYLQAINEAPKKFAKYNGEN